jgi:GntR family transcriptional regulator
MKKTQTTLLDQSFTPLDKSSFTPLYFQIQTQLAQQIRGGRLKPGQGLPGEDELSRLFGVSRMTSRQALQGLKNEGLASRERGRGSFVLEPKVEKDITHLMGFTAEMHALGKQTSAQILAKKSVSATPQVAEQLRISVGAPTLMLRRLRLADKKPLAIEEVTLSLDRFPGLEKLNFANRSLYETLRTKYAVRTGAADETIEARAATKAESALMKIPVRSALLVIARTLLDEEGIPIEAARSLYRGDLYRAVFRLPASA